MTNYDDQFSSERGKGNRNTETRAIISTYINNENESEKYKKASEEKQKEAEKKFGRNGEKISIIRAEAINDRINAIPYDYDKYEDEIDRNNYHEGFFVMGNRALYAQIEKLSDEQLQRIGANDYISGVNLETLPQSIKDNSSYAQGYLMSSIMSTSKGRR